MNGKKVPGGVIAPRRGTCVTQRHDRVDDARFCNRSGCSGRLHSSKTTQFRCSDKSKEKQIIGNPSSSGSNMTHAKSSIHQSQRRSSHSETSESDPVMELRNISPSSSSNQIGNHSQFRETESGKTILKDGGSSRVTAVLKSSIRKSLPRKSSLGKKTTLLCSSLSSASKNNGVALSNTASGSGYALGNLECSSISDIIPRGGSPSEPRFIKRAAPKKRTSEGESSSSCRGEKIIGQLSNYGHLSPPTRGISISEPRHSRSWTSSTVRGGSLVGIRRSVNLSSSFSPPNSEDENCSSITESPFMISQLHLAETPINRDVHMPPYRCSPEASANRSSSFSIPASSGDGQPGSVLFTSSDIGIAPFTNRDASRGYFVDGFAEVLMELERFERNEEQLLALETNLFLSRLNRYDRHRDMRLDIDNMSYEELLALEERIGTVSTALSEEDISKCLNRSIYQPLFLEAGVSGCGGQNDIKCSICQEEYEMGDEVGKLDCEHMYHVQCIEQWFRLKNWCPICKASAAMPKSS